MSVSCIAGGGAGVEGVAIATPPKIRTANATTAIPAYL
jgi:hypothetical protein